MRINRQVLEQAFRTGEPLYTVVDRCIGKTTRAIFRAIADSYDYLNVPITVNDPDATTTERNRELYYRVRDVIATNELDGLHVAYAPNNTVTITNTFAESLLKPIYRTTEGRA